MSYGLDGREFESRQGLGIFLFATASGPVLEPTQPPIQWVLGALSLWVKRQEREADQPLTSIYCRGQEFMELYLHSSNTPSWRGAQLKHGDNFAFYLFVRFDTY
jgi:hypothetical protein